MSSPQSGPSWTDPAYVATVVSVLAVGTLVFYISLTDGGPSVGEVLFTLLWVSVPTTVAYEVARRWL
ncbi:hypothetical protein SAMN04487950_2042 [Halogranum rubrum]|uniref:Uncharacterized protein n=1 Tax=Halogranum rubrum TaxID=553466 RepID=A0A1I4EE75_9EURY|nr:hypothetical protein [Halogranum rubrum]SFL02907.1 hypothetical protein SAMN04487950_2042 [Halogranum rubrum]